MSADNDDLTILLASGNAGKLEEIRQILSDLDVRILTPADLMTPLPAVDEDAETLEGNARKKAETVFGITAIRTVADDTGLEVEALHGKPGVRSARYAGDECNATANRARLLSELAGAKNRSARFRTVVAFAEPGQTRFFEGVCEGHIAESERGDGGFGYDAIFVPHGHEQTFAEMPSELKNRISHRAAALSKLRHYLMPRVS